MSVRILDNGGKTWDRYTVIIGDQVFGMSKNALSPDGFNQWWGELKEFDLPIERLGKDIPFEMLGGEVKEAITRREQYHYAN